MATITQTIDSLTGKAGVLGVRGSTQPLPRNHSLDKYPSIASTPSIGQEFSSELQLSEILKADNSDELIRDLAVTISQRGVVFLRAQDLDIEGQKHLGRKLGELSGKPKDSTLHVHPTTEITSSKGDEISIINSERQSRNVGDTSRLASHLWHSDITFEPVPSDYAILKLHTIPESGGDTVWASAYEAYSRISPELAKFLEGKEAFHEAGFFRKAAEQYGIELRTGQRGSPLNQGLSLSAIHPVIRVRSFRQSRLYSTYSRRYQRRIRLSSRLSHQTCDQQSRPSSSLQMGHQLCSRHWGHCHLGQPIHTTLSDL
ncbi:hypothetical protein, variant 2 [Cryptococcus amylolentus CBS 6039]|uniref:TauD/TfdA-like domain-containing protein n=1 Tax=Cryptococcus amylolentus CBS 6039 TaxID=1295533 RepID=A0A1E3HDV1_9TREE|nr:hypothetical protein, variant 2 [Cryptococcus amylolentus CBS 6039]ODN74522.1 hypothetical protein, variant 2 [Cryptococcus amylolentus CBS 6039]